MTGRCTSLPGAAAEATVVPTDEDGPRPGRARAAGRIPVHDPDLPESERPDALARAAARAGRARARRARCSSWRTTRTRSSATRASRCRASTSSPAARASSTPSPSRRSSRPGLRVGYLIGPGELIARLEALAVQTYLTPALLPQATVHEFVSRGLLDGNVERVVGLLRERRDAMLEAFERELPEGAIWSRPQGGYFTWLDFPEGTDAAALLDAATERRRHVREGKRLLPGRPGRRGVSAPCVQLRLARRHRGGIAGLRPFWASCARAGGGIAARAARRRPARPRAAAGSSRAWTFASRRRSGR